MISQQKGGSCVLDLKDRANVGMLRCTMLFNFVNLLKSGQNPALTPFLVLCFLIVLIYAPPQAYAQSEDPLDRADTLYQDALYEEALAQLPQSCAEAGIADKVRCERIRGLVHLALQQTAEAKAAFARLLLQDPSAELGDDYPPKVQTLFAEAKTTVDELLGMVLLPPTPTHTDGPLILEIRDPAVNIESIRVHIAPPGTDDYEPVDLVLQGQVWSGEVSLDLEEEEEGAKTRYFLDVTTGDMTIPIGSPDAPLSVALSLGSAEDRNDDRFGLGGSTNGEDGLGTTEKRPGTSIIAGLPDWALWSIAGGVAVLATGITIALASGGGPKPARVRVTISLTD